MMGAPRHLVGGERAKGGGELSACPASSFSTSPPLSTLGIGVEKKRRKQEEGEKKEGNKKGGNNRESGGEVGEVVGGGEAQKTARSRSTRLIAVNERGQVIGEGHPRAVLTDHDVELLLELRGEGYSLSWLADKFEVSKSCVAKICRGEHRAQLPAAWRRARGGSAVR